MTKKSRANRRATSAQRLERLANGLSESLEQIPSYKGKDRLIKKVVKVKTLAHDLAWDLKRDAEEDL